jgi:hypothetical protein
MLKEEGQFAHYEPPYLPGEVLTLPNSYPRQIALEKLGAGKAVAWRGLAGDSVTARAGTELRPLEGPVNYLFTLREDGWLDFRFSPRED